MDCSPEYIKMCDCPEIQEQKIEEGWRRFDIGDIIWSPKQEAILLILPFDGNDNLAWDMNSHKVVIRDHHEALYGIWLLRQDQLQILSGLSWKEFDKECLKYDAETKEQAGIQVVIKRLARPPNNAII